jgi:hypothetical protein
MTSRLHLHDLVQPTAQWRDSHVPTGRVRLIVRDDKLGQLICVEGDDRAFLAEAFELAPIPVLGEDDAA